MFGEFRGLPLHALVVHAAVIFVPLAALCAVLFVALPRWRYLLRWPLVALTVISFVNVLVAVQSGLTFRSDLGLTGAAIDHHQSLAKTLRLFMIGFTVVSLAAAWVLGGPSGLRSGRGERAAVGPKALQYAVGALLVVAAVVVIVQVVRTGEAGSRVVYPQYPTGS
jgi:Predicted membrane protein (DUF2231)